MQIHPSRIFALVATMSLAACLGAPPKPPVAPPPPGDYEISLDLASRVQPTYPGFDVIYALGGTVVLDAVITNTGSLFDLRVERSSGHRELDRAALDAVRRWRFEPGNQSGHHVGGVARIPLHFDPLPSAAMDTGNALWPAAYAHPRYVADRQPIPFKTVDAALQGVAAEAHRATTGIPEIKQFQIHDAQGKLVQWWIFTDLGTPDAMATRLVFRGTPGDPVVAVSSLCTHPGVCTALETETLRGPAYARSP